MVPANGADYVFGKHRSSTPKEGTTMANNEDKNGERPVEDQMVLATLVGAVLGLAGWAGNKVVKGQGSSR
jgi:hypothetical protein